MTNQSTFEILLAEDNPADIGLVREALREHQVNCSLHSVQDGAAAIAYLEKLDRDSTEPRLDLLLLDMHLPRRDGEEILRSLRSTERYARTPVIVMTSSAAPSDEKVAEKHAVLHYFRKVSSLDQFMDLGRIVKEVLARQAPVASRSNLEGQAGGAA